ncbi:MAG TPA: 30S ribosomal protein S1 [Bryobacteraceae bacterium]|nr:30S ribosomal protein S1 [Bryobacteraceae bacterium]HPT25449.1 30S ribosomal protein S1 [Bryobacteraceae bacterium]
MTSNQEDRPIDLQGGEQSYEELLEEYSHPLPDAEAGEVLQGHVLQVTDTGVIVDVGLKQEGFVPLDQVLEQDGHISVQAGDAIEVMLDRRRHYEGYVSLSHERASKMRAWETLEKAYREGLLISGRVTEKVKGGLNVDVGVMAFMPSSQSDLRVGHNVDSLIGQDIAVKVIKLNRRRNNVVVSRKSAIEEDLTARKTQVLDHIEEGALVTGVVKTLADYGAFVDLGGIDGLLHVSDMSHGRVNHPADMVHVGQQLTLKVLKLDKAKERISLGLKQIAPDPWETVEQRYLGGNKVIGRVVSVTDYGAFVELEPGVEGLIHISEMTWSRRMKHPSKVVRAGDPVECVVLEVKASERRVSLGIKQLEPDPWTTVDKRYAIGSVVEGRVRKLTDFGAFVEIEEGIDGLVHVSDMSWTKRIQHPSDMLKKGQVVQAVILNIDSQNRRLSLGIKQLQPDAWETFFRSHTVGDSVRGTPSRAVNFGIFVELLPGVEGLCHNSEIPAEMRDAHPPLAMGEEMTFKIIKMSEAEKRIGLAVAPESVAEEQQRIEDYQKQAEQARMSFGEALGAEAAPEPAPETRIEPDNETETGSEQE